MKHQARRADGDPGECARDVIGGHRLDERRRSRTVLPSVASSAMPLMNSKNCVAPTIVYGKAERWIKSSWASTARN